MAIRFFFLIVLGAVLLPSRSVRAQNDVVLPQDGPVAVEVTESIALDNLSPWKILHDNGPLVNSPGTGVGGADESVLQNVTLGMSTMGFDHAISSGWRVADDFTSQQIDWHIYEIVTYAYQTGGGPGASTLSAMNVCIWDGEPGNGGVVVWGNCASNQLTSSTDTGILRVDEVTSGTDDARAIMQTFVETDGLFHFWPRTYWLDWQVDGTLASGPYTPPVTMPGVCETGNGLQSSDGGVTWEPAVDTATGCRQGFPFQLYGYTAIPVELVAFSATTDGPDVFLAWETASETNNAGFDVQHRRPGQDGFETLVFVDGHGTTTEAQTYAHTVRGLMPGLHTFRLKQIDFDGAFEYSDEIEATIEVAGTHVLSEAYPNPFNPQATFSVTAAQSQTVTATLYNALGQRVSVLFDGTVEANRAQTVQIDGAGLASGLYVVRINGERFTDALRVTLLK